MSQGLIKIDTIVREALADKNYSTLHNYPRYLLFALRMLRKLDIDFSETIKTRELPISVKKTVKYPEDYIAYNKVGIKVGDRLRLMTRDNTITSHTPSKYEANSPFYKEVNSTTSYRFYNYYPYNNGTGSSFYDYVDVRGYGHNGVGYFTPVDGCREFQISSEVTAKTIILEYIATNYNPDTETFVPILAQDVFREYIHWQDAMHKSNTPVSKIMSADQEFWSELGNYNMRMSDLSYSGIQDALRRNTTLSIKG
jgi:hypothetical protein